MTNIKTPLLKRAASPAFLFFVFIIAVMAACILTSCDSQNADVIPAVTASASGQNPETTVGYEPDDKTSEPGDSDAQSDAIAPIPDKPLEGFYDVIVAGGEPEGVAAALAAARNGAKTLLVEKGDALGGLMTLGMLNYIDQNRGPDGELLTRGIFLEFYSALGNAFDIDEAKKWFMDKCIAEQNLTVLVDTEIIAPIMDGKTITGLEIQEKNSSEPLAVQSKAVIDATADGDIAAASGAPYTVGGEDYGAHGVLQGVTLVFEVAGVDWDTLVNHIRSDGLSYTGVNGMAAWGYPEEVKDYTPADGNMRFRGPNIARLVNGNVLLNALIIFGVDATDPDSYAEGIARGEREIPYIIDFMRERFPGFENCSFVRHAPRLYVRETRHFQGEYRLTITDVLENRDHWDRIGHGGYPIDVQASSPDTYGTCFGTPDIYSIPFRCLVPLDIEQLLIAGRSASYDSLAHGSARVVPVGMVTGEACGTAAAYSVSRGVSFRQMSRDPDAILWLQNTLKDQGAYLIEYDPPRMAVMDHWAYSGVVVMRELGLAAGGYRNDYQLESDVSGRMYVLSIANDIMRVINERTEHFDQSLTPISEVRLDMADATVGSLLILAAQCASDGNMFDDAADAESYLIERGILDENDLRYFPVMDAIASVGQLYYVFGQLYTILMK